MRSKDKLDLSDFLAGVNTTAADVAALGRVRALDRLDPHAYLQFLEEFSEAHPPDREIPPGREPFVL